MIAMPRCQGLLVALLCLGQSTLLADSKPLELKWTELAPMIASHNIEVELSGGGKVSGEAIAVRDDTIVVDVKKVSGTSQFAKGNGAIPRGAISLIVLKRTRGTWGRSLGTTIGVITGLGAGGYGAAHTRSGGAAVAVVVAVTAGIAVGGYYVGKQLDVRKTRITIAP